MTRGFMLRSVVVFSLVLAAGRIAWANGEEFFATAASSGPVDLVYVGRIKDKSTGRPVRDSVYLTIIDRQIRMSYPFISDKPGHYRSPDIGATAKELSGTTADPRQMQMQVYVPGYKRMVIDKFPRKATGVVDLDIALEPEPTSPALPGSEPPADSARSTWFWVLLVGGATVIGGAAARTLVLRQSTAR